jgi:hypothetical protein
MLKRLIASLILLISIFTVPIYVSLALGLIMMFYFSYFFEALIIFLIADLFYGVAKTQFWDITYVSFLISLLSFVVLEIIKTRLNLSK